MWRTALPKCTIDAMPPRNRRATEPGDTPWQNACHSADHGMRARFPRNQIHHHPSTHSDVWPPVRATRNGNVRGVTACRCNARDTQYASPATAGPGLTCI
jgi:hypothetical protein